MSSSTVSDPRKIIDRKKLVTGLTELVNWSGYTPKTQGQVLEMFKTALQDGWAEVRRRFEEKGASAEKVIHANAYLVDQLVRTIHEFAQTQVYPSANPTTGEQMALLATSGYGRGELAPFSDVDLMFLLPYKLTAHSEQVVEFTLYTLWDMGLKVGHATRSVDETLRLARDDLTIRTSLLEARWLWGNETLFKEFQERFAAEVVAPSGPQFVEAKLAERDARHERMGDTRYVLEPNIKEGKGGLRDLQTLYWIIRYLYKADDADGLVANGVMTAEGARRFAKASNFLWTVRCHLHYLVGRPEERLTFNVQDEIGQRMGYRDRAGTRGVERFMKHYFLVAKDIGDLTRILCAVLEEQHKKKRAAAWFDNFRFRRKAVEGFRVDGGRLNVESDDDFRRQPIKLLQLFQLAQKHGLDIHPEALRAVTQNLKLINAKLRNDPDANQLFMEVLTGPDPEITLMRMNEAGVFGRFVPDFGRVVAQMQYDMYHVYTVDEHTIRAIGILYGIETGRLEKDHPVSHAVISKVQSRRVLYTAVLLHDIAKGRGGDHSEIGAEIALKLGPRFGLTAWETETVSWLVLEHLAMSRTAFKRDIDDPKTVSDFVELVQSPERLRLLLILTVADIRAVGPGVWNEWKAGLLRELYWRALEVLAGDSTEAARGDRVAQAQERLRHELKDWTEEEITDHLALGHKGYWLSLDTETHLRHAHLIRRSAASGEALEIECHAMPERDASEIIVYAPDHPGLFATIAGAMSLSGASIIDAKVQTLTNGMALDTFCIQNTDGNAFGVGGDVARLEKRIEDAVRGRIDPAREIANARERALTSRTQVFQVPPRVLIDNKASRNHTVIEINGRDRVGFLYDVTRALSENGLQISSAHISTYGERAVDVFYAKDIFGLKVEGENKAQSIRSALLAAIEDPAKGNGKNDAGGNKDGEPAVRKIRAKNNPSGNDAAAAE